jgi:hypothetical protein
MTAVGESADRSEAKHLDFQTLVLSNRGAQPE